MYNIISQKIRSSVGRFLKVGGSFFSAVVGAGVGYLYLDQNVAGIRCVQGPSMAPTLNATEYTEEKFKENELGLSDAEYSKPDWVYFTRKFDLNRGDVVILQDPKSNNNILCKRIIALQGDIIVPIGFNNVKKVPITLQEGEIWVESDAGFGYKDSNLFGPVKAGSVQGKVLYASKGYPHLLLTSTRKIQSRLPAEALSRLTRVEQ